MNTTPGTQSLVLSYLNLRRIIGCIGIMLPPVLIFGRIFLESPGILDSISAYYYSIMRDVFVGSLCAIAIFLFSYRYDILDDIAGDIAGLFAIGVALFPIVPSTGATAQQVMIGWLHVVFAGGFFSTLAFFALVLFRRTHQKPTRQKLHRNRVYWYCGMTIVVCLVLLAVVQFVPGTLWLQPLHPIFWLETLAIMAFGIAWFVKGKTLLQDE